MTPTTLPEALTELELVRAELERWRRLANQKSQEKAQLAELLTAYDNALRIANPGHPLLRSAQ